MIDLSIGIIKVQGIFLTSIHGQETFQKYLNAELKKFKYLLEFASINI